MTGRWVEFEREWQDGQIVNCAVCGRLIPRRAWVFDGGLGELQAHAPDCEELYFSYLEPAYGPIEPNGGAR